MWAYQSYGPLWAVMWGDKQYPELARQFLANQGEMIDNYPYMFNRDGRMNMWGRSICYRFAAVTPLPLIEYGKHEGVNYGWLRRIASSTLLQFMQHPEFLENGVPTMGFYGPLPRRCRYTHAEAASTGVARHSSACCSPRIRSTGRQWKTTARGKATCFRKGLPQVPAGYQSAHNRLSQLGSIGNALMVP